MSAQPEPDAHPGITPVEQTGRLINCWKATVRAVGVVLLLVLAWADTGWATGFWTTPTPWLLVGLIAVAGFVAVVRWWARTLVVDHPEASPAPGVRSEAPVNQGGTVICCSGGGIKSASFCLGALQALSDPRRYGSWERTVYQQADAVVAVSGGGYMAAAFAARAARSGGQGEPLLSPGSPGVDGLRRRSNYLASSPRVRFDLISSLLFGLMINLLIVGAAIAVLAWTLVEHVVFVNLVHVEGSSWSFLPSSFVRLFWVPLVVLGFSVATFLVNRYRSRSGPRFGFFFARLAARWATALPTWKSWVSNGPNAGFSFAFAFTLFYPGVPYAAVQVHQFSAWVQRSFPGWIHGFQIATVASLLTGLAGLVRSSTKPRSPRASSGSVGDRLLFFFRARVAPRLGVALTALIAYLALVLVTMHHLPPADSGSIVLLLFAGAAWVVARGFGSADRTSMFPFYRGRLGFAFLEDDDPADGANVSARTGTAGAGGRVPTARSRFPSLAHLRDTRGDAPELVLCATANVKDGDLLPSGRNGTQFIFSDFIGFTDGRLPGGPGCVSVGQYDPGSGLTVDLATAMAVSAAAVSPLVGRADKTLGAYRLLLALTNVRLGVWVRNPYWNSGRPRRIAAPPGTSPGGRRLALRLDDFLDRTSPFQVIREAFGLPSIYSPYVYLTDGGHYDNLAFVEALRRRPSRIVLLDGSGDPEDQFPAMGQAIATARMDLQVEVEFDPAPLQRGGGRYPASGWQTATATYSDGARCVVHYVKCILPEGLSWDLQSYQLQNPDFPATSYRYEMYDEFDFEAFRQLGWSLIVAAENADWLAPRRPG